MAKGFNSRGMGGMGGGSMNNMIRQAQKMQQDMLKAQEDLIVAAVNEALRKANEDAASQMSRLTGGLNLPF